MIKPHHDGQRVLCTAETKWIAQRVSRGTEGTIYWRWIWFGCGNPKHWSTETKKHLRTSSWGSWMPTVVWEGKRDRSGYCCLIVNFNGLEFI
jgi:hypothetical protein